MNHRMEFVDGFFDAAFKFQPRKTTTCFSDGAAFYKATKDGLINMMDKKSLKGIEEFNFEDTSYTLLRKCNYADTIPATILANKFINYWDSLESTSLEAIIFRPVMLLVWFADWYGAMTSVMEISYVTEVFLDREDWYSTGKFAGKILKLVIQIKSKKLFEGRPGDVDY